MDNALVTQTMPEWWAGEPSSRMHHGMLNSGLVKSCLNCEHWNKCTEKCKLADSHPPAEVIVYGCKSWSFDEIPF